MTTTAASHVPQTMLASVLTEVGKIELEQVPVPALESNQVLVKVEAVGVCGSDTHFYRTGHIGDLVVEGPIILGHESAGTIAEVGSAVDRARIGARVSIEPQRPCRVCKHCKEGEYNLCVDMAFYGAYPVDGVFSEYAIIEDDFAYEVPESMNFEEAALVEPVSVAVHACRRAGITAGDKVLIAGAGPIGVITAQVARAFGATEVVVSDPVPGRREFVLGLGATAAVDPLAGGLNDFELHFDSFIDASGNAAAIVGGIATLRRHGRIVLVGMGNDELTLPISVVQNRELELTGTYRYANTWPVAIDLVASGRVQVSPLVTGRLGLDKVEEGLLKAETDPTAMKTVIAPSLTSGSGS